MKFDYLNSKSYKQFAKRNFYNSKKYKNIEIFAVIFESTFLVVILIDLFRLYDFNQIFLFISYMLFSIIGFYIYIQSYSFSSLENSINNIQLKSSININENIADYLSFDGIKVIQDCLQIAKNNKISKIDSMILLIALNKNISIKWILARVGFILNVESENTILANLDHESSETSLIYTNDFIKALDQATQISIKKDLNSINIYSLLCGLYYSNDKIKKTFFDLGIKEENFQLIVDWRIRNDAKTHQNKNFWEQDYHIEGIGRSWASGYTPVLNTYAQDIYPIVANSTQHYLTLGQKSNIDNIEKILSKSGKNNVLLMGEDGVGKSNIVYGFSQKLAHGKVLDNLIYKHVFKLEASSVLEGSAEAIRTRLTKIFNEASSAGNVILYIENFVDLIKGNENGLGSVDASGIILPYLSNGRVQIIATCNYEDYKYKISSNSSIARCFSTIEVTEAEKNETLNILTDEVVIMVEAHNGVFFSFQAIEKVVELSDRYIHDKPFPEKAIDLTQEIASDAHNNGQMYVTTEMVEKTVTEKTKIPVSNAQSSEKEVLLNLEKFLHKRIIGQDEAIDVVANAMRRARSGLKDKNKPIGSFLFIGPTGVGKTETAKALAEAYFKSEKNMIRFDMSEFQDDKSVERLIGSSSVNSDASSQGRLTSIVRQNPYSLVLFDELEKANQSVLNLFLQMVDEGYLTDAAGRKVDFSNTIIIATSNAGAELIRQSINKKMSAEDLKSTIIDYLLEKGIFRPEFLNRFDAVVCYRSLLQDELTQIAKMMLNHLTKDLAEKDITMNITDDAVIELARVGYDPVMGARPMKRVIQDKIENMIAKKLLNGEVGRGKSIEITAKDIV